MSVNYTPPMKGYSGQGAFRFWCQTVLPIVYDDSLSYYELLNKVVVYLNNTIQDVANVEDNVAALLNAYNELQDYVNDYFTDLNIQRQVDNKIDRMVESGVFGESLAPYVQLYVQENLGEEVEAQIGSVVASQIGGAVADQISETVAEQLDDVVAGQIGDVVGDQIDAAVAGQIDAVVAEQIDDSVAGQIDEPVGEAVSDWLEENVDPVGSAVVVDSTLSITGAAADAKKTGDAIASPYDTSTEYWLDGQVVIYNGEPYVCKVNNEDGAFNPSNWAKLNIGEQLFYCRQGTLGILGNEYSPVLTYNIGDVISLYSESYGNYSLYKCTTPITTAEPFNYTHWSRTDITELLADTITNAQIDALFV